MSNSVKTPRHLWVVGIVGFLWNAMEVMGDTFSLVFTAILFLVSIGLYLYARAMQKRGVLR